MTQEHSIQNDIRNSCADIAVLFRGNVGKGVTYDGRHFDTGLPVGFSDLFGFRRSDGRAVFIEVKAPGKYPTFKQKQFLETMRRYNALAGVARSVEDARKIILED